MTSDIKQVSTRDLIRFTKNKTHSQIKKTARQLLSQNRIGNFEEREFVHWQNKKTYTEYLINLIDIDLILQELKPKRIGSGRKRKKIPAEIREEVFRINPNYCAHCGSNQNLCIDHIVPVSRGGSNALDNLQILCNSCNYSKGAKLMHEWLEEV